ncbi:MAG: hypothetical protein PWR01_4043 [Clostridiales bacterium]|nr:hypothetical protein [Clostridiales bacterium]MDN5282970.1 hypothetical protein [Candidatus Ozemobacter sp.]
MQTKIFSAKNGLRLTSWLPVTFLAAIVGIIPFIVYMRVISGEGVVTEVYSRFRNVDFFSYYRSLWLYLLTGTTALWFFLNQKKEKCYYNWFLAIYSFFIIASAVFSQYKTIAEWGNPFRNEGMWVHLCYMVIVFLFINLIKSRKQVVFIFLMLILSSFSLGVIGILQFSGHDYFFSSFTPDHLVPQYLKNAGVASVLTAKPEDPYSVFITFGNSNYTGSYMAMLFLISFVFVFFAEKHQRFFFLPWSILLFINLILCRSRAGFFGGSATFLIVLLFLRKAIRKKISAMVFLIVIYCFFAIFLEIYTVANKRPGVFRSTVGKSFASKASLFGRFDGLSLGKDSAEIIFDGITLGVNYANEKLEFYEGEGKKVKYKLLARSDLSSFSGKIASGSIENISDSLASIDTSIKLKSETVISDFSKIEKRPGILSANRKENRDTTKPEKSDEFLVVFPDNKFRGFAVVIQPSVNLIYICRGAQGIYMVYTESGFKILDHSGKVKPVEYAPAIGFKGNERFASGRGYIWSRTLPLLKDSFFVGYGPDTFFAHFPHYDCVARLKHWGKMHVLVDKPHNLYLQIAFNSGIISLLAILGLFYTYFRQSFKLYFYSTFESFFEKAGLAVMAAVLAYLLAGFFNDSVNSVAPVFWGLVGLGIAINRIVEKKNEEPAKELDN